MPKAYREVNGEWVEYDPKSYRAEAAKKEVASVSIAVRREKLEEYAATVDQLGANGRASLETALREALRDFDPDMPEKDWKELREYIIELLYQTRLYWSDAAGLAACEFYDEIITSRSGLFSPASMPDSVTEKMCADSVRALVKYLLAGNMEKFIEKVCENAQNGIRAFANQTMMHNARRDGMKGVRYARVPVGMETCAFCIMLASRGFVYYSKKSAGENAHMHPHCDCKIVPGFDGDVIEGYDSKVYEAIYDAHNKGKGVNDTLNNIRRDYLYPVHKDHINEVKRQWWARNSEEQNAKRRAKAAERRKTEGKEETL